MKVLGSFEGSGVKFELQYAADLDASQLSDINNAWRDFQDAVQKTLALKSNKVVAAEQEEKIIVCLPLGKYTYTKIPNGYCKNSCCAGLPWYRINTWKGPITIGWRERVIEIDWSETQNQVSAWRLFPADDVTKDEWMIHAWSYDKLKEYLAKILES